MRYIQQNLLKSETFIYGVRPHWVIFSSATWMFVLAFGVLFYGNGSIFEWLIYDSITVREIVAGAFFVIGVYWFVQAYIYYISSEYGVTDKRVVVKTGLIQRKSLELMLDKVEGVLVDQSIIGRIFNYGMITIIGTGGTRDSYLYIPDPLRFRNMVQQQIENFEERFRMPP